MIDSPRRGALFDRLCAKPWCFYLSLAPCALCVLPVHPPRVAAQYIEDCSECTLQLEELFSLGGVASGDGFVGRPRAIVELHDGRFILADRYDQDRLKVYRSDGSFMGVVGRRGKGPGEYEMVESLHVYGDGRIEVWDLSQRRLTILDSQFRVVGSRRIDVPGVWTAVMPDESRVMVAPLVTSESVGLPLHWIDPDGRRQLPFGADPPIQDLRNWERQIRHVAPASDTSVWSAHYLEYTLEEWSVSGELLRRVQRQASWFPRVENGGFVNAESPPNPSLNGIHANEDGTVWTLTWIADGTWQEAVQERRDPYGRSYMGYDADNPAAYFDTVIELVDPRTARILGRVQTDDVIMGFVNDDLVYGYRTDALAEPSIPVFRIGRPAGPSPSPYH